ncbi:hypothetical protein HC823_00840 [Candidatus Gracilibacteria bacterium]|nr:hypothetical protein [Candidatus Gracilibacteria bacterium]
MEVASRGAENQIQRNDAVFLSLAKRKGSNAIDVSRNAQDKLQQILAQPKYAHLTVHTFRDDGQVAQKAINGLSKNLFTSVVIVSLVLLLFWDGDRRVWSLSRSRSRLHLFL